MFKTTQGKEVVVKVVNDIGVLANLTKLVSEKGVNILAVSSWTEGENGIVHLVTDDNLRAMDVLREKNYAPVERDVVLVEARHKPGMLRHLTDVLAREGIDIHYLYASGTIDTDTCLIVLTTANNDRTTVLL
jgi:hypothetical protein